MTRRNQDRATEATEQRCRSNTSSTCRSLCGGGLGARADTAPAAAMRSARSAAQSAPQTIADDGWSDGATECIGHPRWRCSGIEDVRAPQDSGPGSPALTGQARRTTLRSRMRQIKPTGCAGPWRDVPSARLARRGCSSGDGSRASWRGDDCSVGRCASRNPPRLRTHGEQHFRWQVRIWKGTPQLLG